MQETSVNFEAFYMIRNSGLTCRNHSQYFLFPYYVKLHVKYA